MIEPAPRRTLSREIARTCGTRSRLGIARAFALASVLVLHAGEPAGDVARPRTYPRASTLLADPTAAPYRAHVARMGEASLVLGGARTEDGGHTIERDVELPVAGERDGHVRVVVEHDDARTLVWIDAADLAWSITTTARLAGRGDAGVWLLPGAPVTITGGRGASRTVQFDDDGLTVSGAVAVRALGKVFPASASRARASMQRADHLRVTPGGEELYPGALEVEIVRREGAWTLVEHRGRYVHVRGWVPAVEDVGTISTVGSGSGSAFGMSDTDRVAIAQGACLFDGARGAPVARQLAAGERYVASRRGDWWQLYVGTPWGLTTAWAHATPGVGGGALAWEACDRAAPAP